MHFPELSRALCRRWEYRIACWPATSFLRGWRSVPRSYLLSRRSTLLLLVLCRLKICWHTCSSWITRFSLLRSPEPSTYPVGGLGRRSLVPATIRLYYDATALSDRH